MRYSESKSVMKKTLVAKRQIILARPAAQRAASDCLLICLWPRGKAAGRGRACVAAADEPPARFFTLLPEKAFLKMHSPGFVFLQ
nr:hypothetical protein [uncultured Ottowia sp.]